jgi:hypothetical protein
VANELVVRIIGDSKSLERAFARSNRSAKNFNQDMNRQMRGTVRVTRGLTSTLTGLGAGVAGLAGVGLLVREAFGEMADAQKVSAQTAAALKSTAGAAGVTAAEIEQLSEQLMRLSGVDDELIQGSQNVLLTFREVRNEVGRGNDIFTQATRAALDMSVALGTDLQSATLQVGKALQDPIRGITALRRAGVTFTKSQENTIRRLVETGQIVKAQKLIIRELTAEFGGSAKAAGDTLPGKLNILKESLRNLGGTVAEDLAPKITKLVDKFNEWLEDPENQRQAIDDITKSIEALGKAAEKTAGAIQTVASAIDDIRDIRNQAKKNLRETDLGIGAGILRSVDLAVDVVRGAKGRWIDAGKEAGDGYTLGFNTAVQEHLDIVGRGLEVERQRRPPPARQDQRRPGTTARGLTAGERAARRNQWFDAGIARQLNRLQDLGLRKQLAALRALAAQVRERLAATSDATRRLTLEDKLLDIARQQRDVQTQITDQILAANQALKDRADAIKSAVLERLERRQTDILNRRALRDAQARLRLARALGGPQGTRLARENLQDVLFDMRRARIEAAPAQLTAGGRFQLGNLVTINVNGVTDPNQVAIKVAEVLTKRGRRSSQPTRGAAAGSAGGHR